MLLDVGDAGVVLSVPDDGRILANLCCSSESCPEWPRGEAGDCGAPLWLLPMPKPGTDTPACPKLFTAAVFKAAGYD